MAIEHEIKSFLDEAKQKLDDVHRLESRVISLEQRNINTPVSFLDGVRPTEKQPLLLTKSHKLTKSNDLSLGAILRGVTTGVWTGAEEEKKALSTSNAAGGYTLPLTVANEVIDLARAKSVCMDAGVRTYVLGDAVTRLPKVASDPVGTWKAENAALTPTDITFEALDLKPKTLAALVKCSIELFEDSRLVDELIVSVLTNSLAAQLDAAILRGTDSIGAPNGIRFTNGVHLVNAATGAGAAISRELISNAVQTIMSANGSPNAVIMSPREFGNLDRLVDANEQPLNSFPSYQTLSKHVTSAIPVDLPSLEGTPTNTTSEVYVGDFSQAVLGIRTGWTVEASRVAGDSFEKLQVQVRLYGRFDAAVLRPNHFVVIKNVKA